MPPLHENRASRMFGGARQKPDRPRGDTFTATTPGAGPASGSLLKMAWRGRWMVLICVVIALVAGFASIQTATPTYRSSSRLYPDYDYRRPVVDSYQPDAPPRIDRYLQTQAELIKSNQILSMVLELPEVRRMRTFADADVPIASLRDNLSVSLGRRDEIITVSFESPYPVEVAQIVNLVVESYMTSRADDVQANSAEVLEILQKELVRAAKELEEKRDAHTEYLKTGMPVSRGSAQGGGVLETYMGYQTALERAETQTIEIELFRKTVQELADDPAALLLYLQSRGGAAGYSVALAAKAPLESRRITLELRLRDLRKDLTADHPNVRDVEAELEEIAGQLASIDRGFTEAALAAAEQQYARAREKEEEMRKLCAVSSEMVKQANVELHQYDRLQSEVMQATTYYQTVEGRIKEMRKIDGEEIGQLKMAILEVAEVADTPASPRKGRVMATSLLLGLLAGGALAVLRDLLDQTLRSADEMSAFLGMPVLGVVPAMSRRQKTHVRGQRVHLQPDSPEAEAFRTVRTAVYFGAPKDKAKTLLVTSPSAGDGKSTLASNLAIAMAQAGERTILVDADFRKPVQHLIFRADHEEQNLAQVLSGAVGLGGAIQETAIENLSLLPCGPNIANPAEVLNGPVFRGLLAQLSKMYDRVLIDAPPVVVVTDAQILGAICDATILVLRADKSKRRTSQRAMEALECVGARVLGAVVNDVRRSGDRYGYYGGYGGSNGSNRGRNGARKAASIGTDGNGHSAPVLSGTKTDGRP